MAWESSKNESVCFFCKLLCLDPPVFLASDPVVCANNDGRLEAFAVAEDDALWHIWETTPSSDQWGPWKFLAYPSNDTVQPETPGIQINSDGTLELFCIGSDFVTWYIRQVSPGGRRGGVVT
jgi:hypothetical protein